MDENIDSLFQKAKEIPTEIPFEKMEKMILSFPSHPIPATETQWFIKLINLKYIAMTIIPMISILAFWWVTPSNQTEPATPIVETIVSKTYVSPTALSDGQLLESSKTATRNRPKTTFTPLPKTMIEKTDLIPVKMETPKIQAPKPIETKAPIDSLQKKNRPITRPASMIKADLIKIEPTPLSKISTSQLKKLRKILFKNLIADGLVIDNKYTLVELSLLPDQTILNGKPISDELFLKYRSLTEIVGVGPIRKIKMTYKFILVGDFYETGFKGSGTGSFSQDFLRMNKGLFPSESISNKIELKREALEEEDKALTKFAQKIRSTSPVNSGRKRLFSPNVKVDKAKKLHAALKRLLVEDQIIDETNSFAVIQFPKKTIRINGKDLIEDQLDKYKKLMKDYKIKPGQNRMILFSEKIIKVGNFNGSDFAGTYLFLN